MTSFDSSTVPARGRRRKAAVAGLAAALSVGLLAGCATAAAEGDAAEAETVRFQFNWVPDVEWGPWYAAESEGYFDEQGVDVELQHGGPNTPGVAQVVAAGQADIGVASDILQLVQANAEGADLVVIGAMYQRSPFGYTWMTAADIDEPADLVGKRIGGVQGDQIRIDAVFAVNDLPIDYTFVPMGWDPQPLVAGEMDVMTSYISNQPIQLRHAGEDVTAVTFSDFGLPDYGDVLFASRAYLDEHGDAVTAALAALVQGTQANIDDPELVVQLTVEEYAKDSEHDAAFATEANAEYIALSTSDFTDANGLLSVDPEYLENEIFGGLKAAGESDLPPVSEFVDTSFLVAAHKLLRG